MCLFRLLFGLPCPGCGLTRANLLFFSGHFSEAFSMHPLFLVADGYLVYVVWYFIIKRKKAAKPFWVLSLLFVALFFVVYAVRLSFLWGVAEPFLFDPSAILPSLFL